MYDIKGLGFSRYLVEEQEYIYVCIYVHIDPDM